MLHCKTRLVQINSRNRPCFFIFKPEARSPDRHRARAVWRRDLGESPAPPPRSDHTASERPVPPTRTMSPISGHHRKRDDVHPLEGAFGSFARVAVLAIAAYFAYDIRLFAVREYGRIIHEFDPWFNFRATQYLADNGWKKFSTWFDYMSWYPLGRPVGTTIYPGMQVTAVSIFNTLKALGSNYAMSLNDVCVFFPAWFGAVATMLVAFLTAECSGSANSAVIAALVMSVVPAHTMRSVAGGYDNESLAVTAMCLHVLRVVPVAAQRTQLVDRIPRGPGVRVHGRRVGRVHLRPQHGGTPRRDARAARPVLPSLHRAYSLFWIIGTLGAIQFPVVGLAPVKSLEQLGPAFVFLGMQVLAFGERLVKSRGAGGAEAWRIRVNVYAGAAVAACVAIAALAPTGYFGPLSVRVKGLFKMHTRTGNPLVDSVAEHQPGRRMRTGGTSTTRITSRRSVSWYPRRTT